MKDSGIEWIGDIPEHWEVIKLKYLGICRNGLTYSPDNVVDEDKGILVLRSSNIQDGKLVFEDNVYVNLQNDLFKIQKGDILICSRNGSRSLIGKNAIIDKEIKAYYGAFMMIYRCKSLKYMYYILNSNIFKYYLGSFFTSTINQLTGENFKNIIIPYTFNDVEQEKIAAYLDKKCSAIDSIIDKEQKLIEKLKEYKQSLITETVTKGLNSATEMKIKYVAKLNPTCSKIFLPEEKLSYVPMKCVKDGYLIPKENFFKNIISGLTYFENGDIVFAKVTPCFENGNIAIAKNLTNGVAYGSSELFVLRCFGVKKKFLFYVLQSDNFKKNCIASMTGVAGLKRVSSKNVMNYTFLLPPLAEQKKIADFLDKKCAAIDENISKRQALIEKLTEYKKSLIYEVVTGKIEI